MRDDTTRENLLEAGLDTIRSIWSKSYNTGGKPDWSHIYPYYHPEVSFRDSIQAIEGKAAFMALCERLTKRCKELRMDIRAVGRNGKSVFLEWTMTMVFRRSPLTPIRGATVLTLDGDGLIVAQRDYYDLWGDIFDHVPWFRRPYRSFMRRLFG